MEEKILKFWEKNNIFEKSVALRQAQGKPRFVFFEGPPTANGKPGVHHVEARSFKDVILRYKTMKGFYVPRRAGWDTHGLPVEIEVEKKLGLKSKKDIEAYGIAAFNKKCRESVWEYKILWERLTAHMGFWIDMGHAYVTYANEYIETLWWVIKEFAQKGYLYEDYRIVPWCARCGTALSSHELAQGYERIKDESVYVKFKVLGDRIPKGESNLPTYFLAWTTTPWTLPGNVALAVNPDADYVEARIGDDIFILAEARVSVLGEHEVIKKFKGSTLVGKHYEALYPHDSAKEAYRVIVGDFVSLGDGTGIVHIAPAFGDDDFQAGKKNNVPVIVTTNEQGMMQASGFAWDGKFFKNANTLIVEDLKARGFLLKTEIYEHDYPFCWRCKTPLMYLARKTWWVSVNSVRPKLLANNETINWYPDYLKHGRFGAWLKEEKDWAFSRERYWGTPLPVWRCEGCNAWEVIGSRDELIKRGVTAQNRYVIMRHGEAEQNVQNIINNSLEHNHFHLTEKGKKQVHESAETLHKKNIVPDVIVASPFLRTQETAAMIAETFNISHDQIISDPRLGEINTGIFEGKHSDEYHAFFSDLAEKLVKPPPGGETLRDVSKKMCALIADLEKRHQNKTIFLISHEYSLWAFWMVAYAATNEEAVAEKIKRGDDFLPTAGFEELTLLPLPRDEEGRLDFHKPYIDEIVLGCNACGKTMRRVSEVCDVWFDAGSMPYAQDHYPFDTTDFSKLSYPADYIVEAVDQTRGWFYNLLAVSTLLGLEAPYKNVISLGHVLDAKGKKMSKSLGNVVDPMMMLEKYGADTVRWYFFTINQPWDPKLFDEKDVKDVSRRFFVIFRNCFQFWKTYQKETTSQKDEKFVTTLLINKWILARLNQLISHVTSKMGVYDIVGAARDIEQFVVEDVSRWYVRRIRSIMRDNTPESQETSMVLHAVLMETAKLLAPFAPFIAENFYQELKGGQESVHLEDYPADKTKENDVALLETMNEARRVVTVALEARAKGGVKVRQPLQKLMLKDKKLASASSDFLDLIKDEVNAKEIVFDSSISDEVQWDFTITESLKEEGMLRDLVREIQSKRKEAGLKPGQQAQLSLVVPQQYRKVITAHRAEIEHISGVIIDAIQDGTDIFLKILPL